MAVPLGWLLRWRITLKHVEKRRLTAPRPPDRFVFGSATDFSPAATRVLFPARRGCLQPPNVFRHAMQPGRYPARRATVSESGIFNKAVADSYSTDVIKLACRAASAAFPIATRHHHISAFRWESERAFRCPSGAA